MASISILETGVDDVANPAIGHSSLLVDSADHLLKLKTHMGQTVIFSTSKLNQLPRYAISNLPTSIPDGYTTLFAYVNDTNKIAYFDPSFGQWTYVSGGQVNGPPSFIVSFISDADSASLRGFGTAIYGMLGSIVAVNDNGGKLAYWNTYDNRWSYIADDSAV